VAVACDKPQQKKRREDVGVWVGIIGIEGKAGVKIGKGARVYGVIYI